MGWRSLRWRFSGSPCSISRGIACFTLLGLLGCPFGSLESLFHWWNLRYGSYLPITQLGLHQLLVGELVLVYSVFKFHFIWSLKIINLCWHIFKMCRFFKHLLAFLGVHQMALGLFRFLAAAGRTPVVANTMGIFALFLVFVLGGFIVSKSEKSYLFFRSSKISC